jgi:hypothetical protein
MKKIVRLTESDLTRIVKRVIVEEENTNMIANRAEDIVNLPKVEMKIEDIYSNMSNKDKQQLKMALDNLGVDENSSAKEIHSKIENVISDNMGGEMSEEEEESPRLKAARILHTIGMGNIAAWGGVPEAIGIGSLLIGTVGAPMVAGFGISWGATVLLAGLAKLLAGDKADDLEENYKRNYRRR